MKQSIIGLFVATLFFVSCKKEELAPTTVLDEMVDTASVLKFNGIFEAGPYGTASGNAEIYQRGSTFELKLVNFTVNNGPALHVYVSKEAMPVNFIDLGALKSTNGNQVYDISGMPDFSLYRYISIHCVDFNHLFGSALLQ